MAVIIDEIHVEILPGQSTGAEPVTSQPAEGDEAEKLMALLELARERTERLSCD